MGLRRASHNVVVLASASPRRLALLEAAGLRVEQVVPAADETWPAAADVATAVVQVAKRKVAAIGARDEVVIAADTVVLLGDERLGKPANDAEARSMLTRLAGREHRVVTGFCVRGKCQRDDAVSTAVCFRPLTPTEIDSYVASGEGRDKAGAYGIQGGGGALVDCLRGSYTNVIGLPLAEVVAAVEAAA